MIVCCLFLFMRLSHRCRVSLLMWNVVAVVRFCGSVWPLAASKALWLSYLLVVTIVVWSTQCYYSARRTAPQLFDRFQRPPCCQPWQSGRSVQVCYLSILIAAVLNFFHWSNQQIADLKNHFVWPMLCQSSHHQRLRDTYQDNPRVPFPKRRQFAADML